MIFAFNHAALGLLLRWRPSSRLFGEPAVKPPDTQRDDRPEYEEDAAEDDKSKESQHDGRADGQRANNDDERIRDRISRGDAAIK